MPPTSAAPSSPWLRGPLWDTALIAFPWVPVWLWVAYGLGLASGPQPIFWRPAFSTALVSVLALTFLHRQYVFVLVYGDRTTFASRPRAFVVVPFVLFAVVGAAVALRPGFPLALTGVLVLAGVWNVWHTVMQRYGLMRVYASRAGGSLASPRQARLDLALLASSIALVAVVLAVFRARLLLDHPATLRVLELSAPLRDGPLALVVAGVSGAGWLAIAIAWARAELGADVPIAAHRPRLVLLASTFALLAVFVVSGPIIGYLAFGAAHALEYVAFVNHVGKKKYEGAPGVIAARLFRSPLLALGLVLVLPATYLVLSGRGVTALAAYVVYDVASALTHFVLDGWVWKVRKPTVAGSVVAAS